MSEERKELKVFRIDYLCDSCNTPIEVVSGYRNSIGEKWHHRCPNKDCNRDYNECFGYNVKFPRIEYSDLYSTSNTFKI